MTETEVRAIRLTAIAEEIDADAAVVATAMALEDLAIVTALVMIHGKEHGYQKYIDTGGRMRFDEEGELVILWSEDLRDAKARIPL
jgi:hypothetical protein